MAVYCSALTVNSSSPLILKEIGTNNATGRNCTPHRLFRMTKRAFKFMRVVSSPTLTVLFIHITEVLGQLGFCRDGNADLCAKFSECYCPLNQA
jgi:hypothetical protein